MCNATGRDIDAADNISTVETIQETTGHWAEDENSAAASVKFIKPKPSDDSMRFVISKDKISAESRNVNIYFHIDPLIPLLRDTNAAIKRIPYGEAFRANSLGHAKNWTLASHITQPRSARKTELVWAHLVGEHGSICHYKADDHGNRDYVRDDDKVYLCLINTNGTNPQGPQVVDGISRIFIYMQKKFGIRAKQSRLQTLKTLLRFSISGFRTRMKESSRQVKGHECRLDPHYTYVGAVEFTDISGQSDLELSFLNTS